MRVLITGGAGFIGAAAARSRLSRGDEVWVVDDLSRSGSPGRLRALQANGLSHFIRCDISHQSEFQREFARIPMMDAVIHLASQVAVTTSVEDPLRDFQINAGGTLHLLEWVRQHSPGADFLYSSTNKVYGGLEDLLPQRQGERLALLGFPQGVGEDRPVDFHSPYGCSKGAADLYCIDYARIYGLRTAILRQSCIYGPGQSGEERQGWVSCFARAVRDGEPLTFYGDGYQTRDLLYIDDLVALYDLLLEREEWQGGQVWNVGGGAMTARSLWEVLAVLTGISGRPTPVSHGPPRPGDQPVFVADTGKAERELGWRPRILPEEGISRLWEDLQGEE